MGKLANIHMNILFNLYIDIDIQMCYNIAIVEKVPEFQALPHWTE